MMWLLHTSTGELRRFDLNVWPVQYAILSHVWGAHEQSFQDIQTLQHNSEGLKGASPKIRDFCIFARSRGYEWCWADTCCIDKTSSAELSEAINSMFQWYQSASLCVAYLADVSETQDPHSPSSEFRSSLWFTRGWTLQELIAPAEMLFVGRTWTVLGSKRILGDLIEEITGVDRVVLDDHDAYSEVPVARRMSWAANRTTTRVEDEAYSLMGLFDVHMPTIYGEGRNAFIRLQEEILRRIPDQSIFTWGPRASGVDDIHGSVPEDHDPSEATDSHHLLLATSPASFARTGNIIPLSPEELRQLLGITQDQFTMPQFNVTSYGMRAQLPIIQLRKRGVFLAVLACTDAQGLLVALVLHPQRDPARSHLNAGRGKASPHTAGLLGVAGHRRTVSLTLEDSKNLSARMGDICIRHRQDWKVHRPLFQSTDSASHITAPCEIVLLPWTLDLLAQEGFELFLPTTNPPGPPEPATESDPSLRSSTASNARHPPILVREGRQPTVVRLTHRDFLDTITIQFRACADRGVGAPYTERGTRLHAFLCLGSLAESQVFAETRFSCRGFKRTGRCREELVTAGSKEFLWTGVQGGPCVVRLTFAVLTTRQGDGPLVSVSIELLVQPGKRVGRPISGARRNAGERSMVALKPASDAHNQTRGFLSRLLLEKTGLQKRSSASNHLSSSSPTVDEFRLHYHAISPPSLGLPTTPANSERFHLRRLATEVIAPPIIPVELLPLGRFPHCTRTVHPPSPSPSPPSSFSDLDIWDSLPPSPACTDLGSVSPTPRIATDAARSSHSSIGSVAEHSNDSSVCDEQRVPPRSLRCTQAFARPDPHRREEVGRPLYRSTTLVDIRYYSPPTYIGCRNGDIRISACTTVNSWSIRISTAHRVISYLAPTTPKPITQHYTTRSHTHPARPPSCLHRRPRLPRYPQSRPHSCSRL